ncbi:hypothetical protein A8B78_17895 [Jannaschia sp. EhC01]|nr:hypothetical protein A8B78_17895 [Jannaschia sp. EhC01]
MVPVIAATCQITGANAAVFIAIGVFMGAMAFIGVRIGGHMGATLASVALAGQAIVFTSCFAGNAFQIDSHMFFFAALAVVAMANSIPALLVTTVVIALHHLSFGLLMPALVFPSTDVMVNLIRVAFHAVIVLVEVGILILAIRARNQQEAAKQDAILAAAQAREVAETNADQADRMREEAEQSKAQSAMIVARLAENLSAMASRDLSRRLEDAHGAQFRQIVTDYNRALDIVSDTLAEAIELVAEVDSEASVSAQKTGEIATQLEGQAIQVSTSAESIREITASLQQTVKNIDMARDMAETASQKAAEGGRIVRAAVEGMARIKTSSGEISKIIAVIEDISFQTNLLALNAGVEAARAGAAGSGFAVVASEVRALANRTSEAATQVKGLISDSITQVADGATMVDRAGTALDEIEGSVAEASRNVNELSTRVTEQSGSVNDLAGTLSDIETVIQNIAVNTEELSATGSRIASGAVELNERLRQFTVKPNGSQRYDAIAAA